MAAITASAVNELRQATGCGLMDCKKALVENEGDFEKAVVYLREKGLASQAKKATRVAAEGMAYAAVIDGVGVIVEVNCESDFVAGGPLFNEFVSGVAKVIAKEAPADVDALMACPWYTGNGTVDDAKNELFLSVRENMKVRRFERIEGKCVPYVHMKGKVAVLVELETEASAEAVTELGRDVAMQICALNPQYLDESNVPAADVEKEKEILRAQAINEGKPEKIVDRMVEGRIEKYYKEVCLLDQQFVKDGDKSIKALMAEVAKETGATLDVVRFTRFERGEGIEKRQDNLAEEIAQMTKA